MTSLLRLESAGVVRARWFLAALVVSAGLVGFFLVLASRESAVVGFTGFGRVLSGVVLASLLFIPLLAVSSTAQAVTQARSQGLLEWYLSHPVSRASCFWSMFAPRAVAVAVPVAASVVVLGGLAAILGHPLPVALLGRFTVLLVGQAFCFSALGMAVSVVSRTAEQALLAGLTLWMTTVALIDLALVGVMLRWNVPPHLVFLLAGANPVQAGRIGILAGTDPNLGLLGPVGTWIASTLGPAWTLAYALGWPILLGTVALAVAARVFSKRDIL
jgi:ABC-type transport system involved in multi-copper enzyme maturation permease subunit